jgi:Uma2 family endonuclease
MVDSGKRREATYQDVLDAPEHMVAEIIDGSLVLSPRPANPHAISMTNLGVELIPPFSRGRGGPGGWIIVNEPEIHFGKNVLVPDMAGWRRERMQVVSTDNFFTLRPDWVCEGLSKSTARIDRSKKMPIYAEAGVGHCWLLDERSRSLEVYRLVDRHFELVAMFDEGEAFKAEPFEAIELRLANLFIDLPTRAGESYVEYGR